jgi:hypothetical protein
MTPNLQFKISCTSDINNCLFFVKHNSKNNKLFLKWFLPKNFQYILNKNFTDTERNKIIREYTKHIYKLNQKEIKEGLNETEIKWRKIENKYYNLVSKLFKGHPWPKGKYLGIASIYSMYPRNIKDQYFYLPYSHKNFNPLSVIGHEMLHFIF